MTSCKSSESAWLPHAMSPYLLSQLCFGIVRLAAKPVLHAALADGAACAGLANPGPVAAALWTDEELESGVCLDAIVTVVDARNISNQLAGRPGSGHVNEAQQQLAYADVVLLNKVHKCCC